jgi:Polyketide cyclase / dehydrase and lipid transport
MSPVHVSAGRVLDAPADVVYHCIADYREHHRPDGFLPPAFKTMQVEGTGYGEGTTITYRSVVGGVSRTATQHITEPEPGRVLVETGDGATTTFTVDPQGPTHCNVRFDTVLDVGGLEGLLTRLFAPRLLRPLYLDELDRLERHAQHHVPHSSPQGVLS